MRGTIAATTSFQIASLAAVVARRRKNADPGTVRILDKIRQR